MNDDDVLWQQGDTVTDLDTEDTGTIVDAGDGDDLDTMEINWEESE
jgi:hypothetical protein